MEVGREGVLKLTSVENYIVLGPFHQVSSILREPITGRLCKCEEASRTQLTSVHALVCV